MLKIHNNLAICNALQINMLHESLFPGEKRPVSHRGSGRNSTRNGAFLTGE